MKVEIKNQNEVRKIKRKPQLKENRKSKIKK